MNIILSLSLEYLFKDLYMRHIGNNLFIDIIDLVDFVDSFRIVWI